MLKAAVSGSFHRHMIGIYEAVGELHVRGIDVLSPSDPRVVDNIGDFLFVASDRLRSIKLVQDRHLEAIRASDFLLVVCPDGYTGASTSGEIMAAFVLGVPVVSLAPASDVTIGQYVHHSRSLDEAIAEIRPRRRAPGRRGGHVLIDPAATIGQTIASLEALGPALTCRGEDGLAERRLAQTRGLITEAFGCVDVR